MVGSTSICKTQSTVGWLAVDKVVSQLRAHIVTEKLLSVLYSGSPAQRSLQASSDHGMAKELAGGDFRFVGTAAFTFRDRHATGQ